MSEILMRLGPHEFTVSGLNYQRLSAEFEARWKENYTAGGAQIDQFFGLAAPVLTISGAIFDEEFGGYDEARQVAETAARGEAVPLYASTGRSFGDVKILTLSLTQDVIGPGGRILEASYEIKVSRYGGNGDRNPLLGSNGLANAAASLLPTLF